MELARTNAIDSLVKSLKGSKQAFLENRVQSHPELVRILEGPATHTNCLLCEHLADPEFEFKLQERVQYYIRSKPDTDSVLEHINYWNYQLRKDIQPKLQIFLQYKRGGDKVSSPLLMEVHDHIMDANAPYEFKFSSDSDTTPVLLPRKANPWDLKTRDLYAFE